MTSPAPRPRDLLVSADLHRVDQAAWILAHKDPAPNSDTLLTAAAGVVLSPTRRERSDLVIALVAAMIDRPAGVTRSEEQVREDSAARRLAALLALLAGSPEAALVQQAIRRGGFEGPLPLPAARRLRRGLKRALRETSVRDADVEPLRGLAAAVWESLLDALARSLAFDADDEILTDVALDAPAGERPVTRLARVRALLHGDGRPRAIAPATEQPTPRPEGGDPAPGGAPGDPPAFGRRIGRFVLLQRIGSGAMGVVYAAYDDQLDRKIAIKLLRPQSPRDSARAQLRLFREAQAMARLSHPNVAVVHEVGTDGTAVYVAMEFIRGVTVQTWLSGRQRPWRDIVDVFLQAGRGLAAAHAAGLVHRDFKPSNVMIGLDGRVRVLDFGLCSTGGEQESGEHPAEPPAPRDEHATAAKVTQGGEVVGTPAYMPPEQFSGQIVGPPSDQFAFCVSLYEALYGQLPFPGETVHELAHAVARGEVRDPPRGTRVPAWLHAVVLRGLRPAPRDRYPTMDALLRALDRTHVLRRRTYLATLAFAGTAALAGFFAAKAQRGADDPCSGGGQEIQTAWNDSRRAAAERAFVVAGHAYATEMWPRVQETLDIYAATWAEVHRDACLTHRRSERSDTLYDRQIACLAQRKTALAAAATLLGERDPNIALHALETAATLPAVARCTDLAALEAEVPPPTDPKVAARARELRAELGRVSVLDHASRQGEASRLADRIAVEAESLGDRALLASALLEHGKLALNVTAAATDEQEDLLRRALLAAVESRDDEVAAEAMARLIFLRGRIRGQAERALEDLPLARALVARLPAPERLRGLLLNNAGVVTFARGDAAGARVLLVEALRAKQSITDGDRLEVASTLFNLALIAEDRDAGAAEMIKALAIFEEILGPAHGQTIEVRITASLYTRDPGAALSLLTPGCEALARFAAQDVVPRARCLAYLGHHSAEAGLEEDSRKWLRQADRLLPKDASDTVEISLIDKTLIRGYAALDGGDHRAAAEELRSALGKAVGDEWWQRRFRAEFSLVLGLHLRASGDLEGAEAALQAAVDEFSSVANTARDVLIAQRLQRARVTLAAVLLASPAAKEPALARAQGLLAAAALWYREAGDAYAWRLAEVQALEQTIAQRRPATGKAP